MNILGRNQPLTVAILFVFCLIAFGKTDSFATDDFEAARHRMVRMQISRDLFGRTPVKDTAVLEAMRKVPRHLFVPKEYRDRAYRDDTLHIGNQQTISQPYIVGFMTEALRLKPDHIVLEIGTGSGYQAAVLGELAKQVYTIEIVPQLGNHAKNILSNLDYKNVEVKVGDGYKGWAEHAPFDAIIVTAAPDHIPQPLIDQLKPGGRLVIPVGPERQTQKLLVIEKKSDETLKRSELMLVRFVPFTGESVEIKTVPPPPTNLSSP
jgi:protein-L-isoaspartate(D-aspartate) O-methyltransferase